MKPLTYVLALMVLCGCGQTPSETASSQRNNYLISETKKCEAAGMKAIPLHDWDGDTFDVRCEPK